MKELKFNSQICTTKEQSQRLLDLGLKHETADMRLIPYTKFAVPMQYNDGFFFNDEDYTHAWSLHRLIELYKDVEDTSMWSLENVNYNRLIQCISFAIKNGIFNKEYLKQ